MILQMERSISLKDINLSRINYQFIKIFVKSFGKFKIVAFFAKPSNCFKKQLFVFMFFFQCVGTDAGIMSFSFVSSSNFANADCALCLACKSCERWHWWHHQANA